jgi:hypothetical protein
LLRQRSTTGAKEKRRRGKSRRRRRRREKERQPSTERSNPRRQKFQRRCVCVCWRTFLLTLPNQRGRERRKKDLQNSRNEKRNRCNAMTNDVEEDDDNVFLFRKM